MIHREDLHRPAAVLRIFDAGKRWGDAYSAVLILTWETEDVVYASAFAGSMSRSSYMELAKWLRDAGVKTVKANRVSGHVMPMSRLIDGAYHFDVGAFCNRYKL